MCYNRNCVFFFFENVKLIFRYTIFKLFRCIVLKRDFYGITYLMRAVNGKTWNVKRWFKYISHVSDVLKNIFFNESYFGYIFNKLFCRKLNIESDDFNHTIFFIQAIIGSDDFLIQAMFGSHDFLIQAIFGSDDFFYSDDFRLRRFFDLHDFRFRRFYIRVESGDFRFRSYFFHFIRGFDEVKVDKTWYESRK